ncbi:hypothetical protein ACQP2T_63745 (plasmid) [Nonomuraea sp. CA-143628]|uniref:hypothetical protein n=1 Tax=Nonomuraea sp. CA-143628 TaxID=3239997 RepID=UPI003D918795
MTTTEAERNPLLNLLTPFSEEMVGKLPRIICPACSRNRGSCDEHQKTKCGECGATTTPRHIHLDYVGHADVTRRLIETDPEWSWEPVERDVDPQVLAAAIATGNPDMVRAVLDAAPPKFDVDSQGNPVGLWIYLIVLGVRRRGYGSCPGNQSDAAKVLIGDALRNAAMRFGVALDLWAKGDRADPSAENAVAAPGRRAQQQRQQAVQPAEVDEAWVIDFQKRLYEAKADQIGRLKQEVLDKFKQRAIDPKTGNELMDAIKQRQADLDGQAAA